MPDTSDTDLLDTFVRTRSETAFTTLVERYRALVYGTALRRTADPELAKDISQTTFAILARKAASLRKIDHLSAWLHRTTVLEAKTAIRTESRHRRKMTALMENLQRQPGDGSAPDPGHAHLLDQGIEHLPESDRRVLLLHYFDGLTFRQIATATGTTESAAQRRGHRALQKLSARLRRAGAAASVTALATALATQLPGTAIAVPAATSLVPKALAASTALPLATVILNTIHTMSTAKLTTLTAAAVILVAAVPLGIQRSAIASGQRRSLDLESHNTSLRKTHDLPPAPTNSAAPRGLAGLLHSPDPTAGRASAIDIIGLADDIYNARDKGSLSLMTRIMGVTNSVAEMPDGELDTLFDNIASAKLSDQKRYQLVDTLLRGLRDKRPAIALELSAAILRDGPASNRQRHAFQTTQILGILAATDPDAALDFYRAASNQNLFASRAINGGSDIKRNAIASLFAGLLQSDKSSALAFYDSLSDDWTRGAALDKAAFNVLDTDHLDTYLGLVKALPEAGQQRDAYANLAAVYARKHPLDEGTAKFIHNLDLDPPTTAFAVRKAAFSHAYARSSGIDDQLAWVRRHTPDDHVDENIGAVIGNYSRFNNQRQQSLAKLAEVRTAGAPDSVVYDYLRNSDLTHGDPSGTLRLIDTLTDPQARADSLHFFARQWANQSEHRLASFLNDSPLPPEEIQATLESVK